MKRIYAIEAWCIDCKRCEVACKTFHSRSKDPVKAFLLEYPEPHSRVRVEGDQYLSVAVNCRHCVNPGCVEGCISGAMTKDPITGVVTSDPEKCVGCRTCVSMCPFGCVSIEKISERLPGSRGLVSGGVAYQGGEVPWQGGEAPCREARSEAYQDTCLAPYQEVALKCDLCGDGHGQPGEPKCVEACPNRALIYVESEAC